MSVRQAQTPHNSEAIKYAAVINHPLNAGSPNVILEFYFRLVYDCNLK